MKKKLRETDFVYANARIRALENNMLTKERLLRMLESKLDEDALKVLSECAYSAVFPLSMPGLEEMLLKTRAALFEDALKMSPDRRIVELFLIRYDYHNLKAIIKGASASADYKSSLAFSGRYPCKDLEKMLLESDFRNMPPVMAQAAGEAKDVLAKTSDPQAADIILDRACFDEMLSSAEDMKSAFLIKFVKLSVDSVNLRTAVRLKKMGRGQEFLRRFLLENGTVPASRLFEGVTPELLSQVYSGTVFGKAAEAGSAALRGEKGLAALDLECDNAVLSYLKSAKYTAFGEGPLAAYLYAREAELTAVRIVLTGRLKGLPAERVMESLRDTYV
ncbi:MAG: V-type ATPase subunit [Bacillota bacterium]|nr:V-type ATPase subunit [Bacillota bacterium]